MATNHGDRDALTYCRRAGLSAVFISPAGRIRVGPDPLGAHAVGAWWAKTNDAVRVAELARQIAKRLPAAAAIIRAATQLEVTVTNHATAMTRAHEAIVRLEQRTREASDNGALAAFHREYRRRRLVAAAHGERFMTYRQARQRLRTVLETTAASGEVPGSVVAAVFDGLPR
jgi:hypothetical protein